MQTIPAADTAPDGNFRKSPATGMDVQTINGIKSACAEIVSAFAYYVDHREFARAVALFTDDGVFERAHLKAKGHQEIAAIWTDRPATTITRHLCGPPFFRDVTETRVSSVTYFTLFHVESGGEAMPRFDRPAAIAEFHDVFVLTSLGWQIAHRKGLPILVPVDPEKK